MHSLDRNLSLVFPKITLYSLQYLQMKNLQLLYILEEDIVLLMFITAQEVTIVFENQFGRRFCGCGVIRQINLNCPNFSNFVNWKT